jgi:branched-chain amino acid transport system ATP-binding protein
MVMDAGEVISQGNIEDVLADPKDPAAYFEDLSE